MALRCVQWHVCYFLMLVAAFPVVSAADNTSLRMDYNAFDHSTFFSPDRIEPEPPTHRGDVAGAIAHTTTGEVVAGEITLANISTRSPAIVDEQKVAGASSQDSEQTGDLTTRFGVVKERQWLRQRLVSPHGIMSYPFFWWLVASCTLIILLSVFLVCQAATYRKRLENSQQDSKLNSLLVSALDQIAASIVIYDSDLLAIHWNAGFERAFPSLIPDFENGKSMPEMIAQSYRDGTIQSDMTDTEIDCFVDGLIEKMRDGTSPTRTVRLGAGQAFEARDFKVGANNYASIRVDVTRLQDQQDTIADQAKRLEIVNGQLQSFAFIAAHDLRAPLYQQQALMGFIVEDMAEARITVPPEVQANWTVIEALSGRMMVLIKDLLAFAQAEVKDQPKDLVSPSKRLEDIVALVNQKAGFEVVIAPDMPEVLVNATAFDTVMRNLISNGIKHHDKQKGRVTVRGQVDGAFVRISVEDDGVGIPSQHIGTIFEPFKRLSASGDGIGLGLAHIKKTVEAWGGSVSVTPLMPRGSVFAITIPNHRLTLISS